MRSELKHCKGCDMDKLYESEFYKTTQGYAQTYCKSCMCQTDRRKQYKTSYVQKATGIDKLDIDVKNRILSRIENKETLKKISTECNIPYITIKVWKKKGII
jgi:hypothetical protein